MTKRTRLFLFIAAGILIVGLGTGLLASYMGLPVGTFVGSDGPDELKYIPVDATLVAFADVRDVMDSEMRQKLLAMRPAGPASADGFEARTGINVEHDIDRVVAGVLEGEQGGDRERPLVLARGRFDTVRVEGLVREHGGHVEDYKGERLLTFHDHDQDVAVAFIEPGLAAVGTPFAVHRAIDTGQGNRNVTDNAEIMAFVRDVGDGNAWAVGRFDALSAGGHLPRQLADQLPPINWFTASGRVDRDVRGSLRVEARDDAAAQNLRDVVGGFIALGRLQAGANAELKATLNALEVGGHGTTVSLAFSLSPETVNLLGLARGGRGVGNPHRGSPLEPPAQPPTLRPQAQVF